MLHGVYVRDLGVRSQEGMVWMWSQGEGCGCGHEGHLDAICYTPQVGKQFDALLINTQGPHHERVFDVTMDDSDEVSSKLSPSVVCVRGIGMGMVCCVLVCCVG